MNTRQANKALRGRRRYSGGKYFAALIRTGRFRPTPEWWAWLKSCKGRGP